jgi:hypothetical protein
MPNPKCRRLTPAITKQAQQAYIDTDRRAVAKIGENAVYERRSLNYVTPAMAPSDFAKLAPLAVQGESYNNFEPMRVAEVFAKYEGRACIRLGRNGSPMVIVEGPPEVLKQAAKDAKKLLADEINLHGGYRQLKKGEPLYDGDTYGASGGEFKWAKGAKILRLWWD